MNTDSKKVWTPFPASGRFIDDPSWGNVFSNPQLVTAALGGLSRAFPVEWVCRLQTDPLVHPFVADYVFKGNRFFLIELGLAINAIRPKRAILQRLREPKDYLQTRAELNAGLMLYRLGACKLIHESMGKKGGPDWVAVWPDGSEITAEVKCPNLSEAAKKRQQVSLKFLFEFMNCDISHLATDSTTWCKIDLVDDLIQRVQYDKNGDIDKHWVHELVQEHILPIFRQLPRPLRDAVISIDNFGLMTILTKEGPPSFNWEMKPISPEKTHSIARITKILAEATEQLSKIQLPGIIVLDLYCDWPVIQYIEDIDTVIKHAAWAKPLAAVLVPDRKIDGDVAICSIGVISGQRYSDLQGPVPAWKLIDGTWVDIPILTESQVAR